MQVIIDTWLKQQWKSTGTNFIWFTFFPSFSRPTILY
jgi:hypothetical protein